VGCSGVAGCSSHPPVYPLSTRVTSVQRHDGPSSAHTCPQRLDVCIRRRVPPPRSVHDPLAPKRKFTDNCLGSGLRFRSFGYSTRSDTTTPSTDQSSPTHAHPLAIPIAEPIHTTPFRPAVFVRGHSKRNESGRIAPSLATSTSTQSQSQSQSQSSSHPRALFRSRLAHLTCLSPQ
jgi:hypothetical protein